MKLGIFIGDIFFKYRNSATYRQFKETEHIEVFSLSRSRVTTFLNWSWLYRSSALKFILAGW